MRTWRGAAGGEVVDVARGRRGPAGRSGLISKLGNEVELLQRHIRMLQIIQDHQPIGIIRLAEMAEQPQHKIRYSLRILEQENLIKPSPEGAVATERAKPFLRDLRRVVAEFSSTFNRLKKDL